MEKRAFVHWLVADGRDEGILHDFHSNMRDTQLDYKEVRGAMLDL